MTLRKPILPRYLFMALVAATNPLKLSASPQVVLIGGGPTPGDSQASIELNTRWIRDVILRHDPDRVMQLYFTDGNDSGPDVRSWSPEQGEAEIMQPLARVFGSARDNGVFYYSSHIADDAGTTSLEHVSDSLRSVFGGLSNQDELLLIYQGHGGWKADTNNNYLRLWGETHMTVTELEGLMSEAEPGATIRFFLPQCFSGAFSRLVYKDAEVSKGLAAGNRCGFLAQQEDSESEGCTDSVNTGDYRDYSSYFYSALDGKTMGGAGLSGDPDRNADGTITLLEAHYYALGHALSVDYSRSTSQDYLENWQPWYLRWLAIPAAPDNAYSEIAEVIARRFGVGGEKGSVSAAVAMRMKSLDRKIAGLEEEQQSLRKAIKKYQKDIQRVLSVQWPEIRMPYTNGFRVLVENNRAEIQQAVITHESYSDLVTSQDREIEVENNLLDARRERVQMDKIIWMKDLARTLEKFRIFASDREKSEYARLVRCEDAPL